MSDAGLQHFLGSAVINRQGLLELRHSDVSHHAVAGEVEELHVLGVGGFGVHRSGEGAGGAGAFLGESGVVGVRGVDHAAVFLVGECLDGRVVVADDARGVLHDEEVADRRVEQDEQSDHDDQQRREAAQLLNHGSPWWGFPGQGRPAPRSP